MGRGKTDFGKDRWLAPMAKPCQPTVNSEVSVVEGLGKHSKDSWSLHHLGLWTPMYPSPQPQCVQGACDRKLRAEQRALVLGAQPGK